MRPSNVLEVKSDLADHDDHLIGGQLAQRSKIRLRGFERMVPDPGPDLLVRVAEAHRVRAVLEIDADADQPGHTRRDRLFDHLGGIA